MYLCFPTSRVLNRISKPLILNSNVLKLNLSLDSQSYQVLRVKNPGSRDCQLTFEWYCKINKTKVPGGSCKGKIYCTVCTSVLNKGITLVCKPVMTVQELKYFIEWRLSYTFYNPVLHHRMYVYTLVYMMENVNISCGIKLAQIWKNV